MKHSTTEWARRGDMAVPTKIETAMLEPYNNPGREIVARLVALERNLVAFGAQVAALSELVAKLTTK